MLEFLVACLCAVNVFSFVICALDKHYAKTKRRRISERMLLTSAFLFGSIGMLRGMMVFRHKTKHWKFIVPVPIFCIIHSCAVFLAVKYNLI